MFNHQNQLQIYENLWLYRPIVSEDNGLGQFKKLENRWVKRTGI